MLTVQGTITRKSEAVLNGLQTEFLSLYTYSDFEEKLEQIKDAQGKSDFPSKMKSLFDMFRECKIDYEIGRSVEYYEELIRNAKFPSFAEIEDRMIRSLFSGFRNYATPKQYMQRIVDRCSKKEDHWEEDSLRLRILKQFIKYGKCLMNAHYAGKEYLKEYIKQKAGLNKKPSVEELVQYLDIMDDDVFSVLGKASKDDKKPGGKYGLLRLADDLAEGRFRAEGATKKALYLFAMVYDMTFYSGAENEIRDYKTDLEGTLFRDYYCNNLMQYVSDVYRGNLCSVEVDPSGMGINYKNFSEAIYLYFLCQDLKPAEKIRLATQMIDRVREKCRNEEKPADREERNTVYYKGIFFGKKRTSTFVEDIMMLPNDEFEAFICENYNCNTVASGAESKEKNEDSQINPILLETDQNTAYDLYQEILKEIQKLGLRLENCNYGLWFADMAALEKKGVKTFQDRLTDLDQAEFQQFIEILKALNNFIGNTVKEEISEQKETKEHKNVSIVKIDAMKVQSPKDITRTSMITAFYYYYNAKHEGDEKTRWRSFEKLFNHFKAEIDQYLEVANYQLLSGKNIFDVLVVFSSYAYLNL